MPAQRHLSTPPTTKRAAPLRRYAPPLAVIPGTPDQVRDSFGREVAVSALVGSFDGLDWIA